jgi:hypothetical protein
VLPAVAVDVEPYLDGIYALGEFYLKRIGFGERAWIEERLRTAGAAFGLRYAEVFDAWESAPGIVPSLLPAGLTNGEPIHPDRKGEITPPV